MNNDEYWYNITEENGIVSIQKALKNSSITTVDSVSDDSIKQDFSTPKARKQNWKPVFIVLPILVIIPFIVLLLINFTNSVSNAKKYRTFMLYMVGSDLESSGSIATYDLNDINGQNIDLENNNVILMVGGSKKWHNFVDEDEIGIYELTKSGFKKVKSNSVSSMGSINTLSSFLDYSYDKYPADKYDLIFWNHGLGAVGLEVDEVSDDFIDISELNSVFKNSPFAKEKLELVIFNNCLAANIHFASIMKDYAEYMVASEEVMYVGLIIDRLNFLESVKVNDNGYDIGLLYINKSDESVNMTNKLTDLNIDSTLSIIDLSKIDEVEKNMNDYFNSIDLEDNYRLISIARRMTTTYGIVDFDYDTVDLYSLANSLEMFADSEAKENLQNSIKSAVKYNSAMSNYSNGLSVYFPYYGEGDYIATHLYYFSQLWNNDYVSFISKYYRMSSGVRSNKKANIDGEVLTLQNNVQLNEGNYTLELTNEEKESFQNANVYIFNLEDNKYNLLSKTDEVQLDGNTLKIDIPRVVKSSNNKIISSNYKNGVYSIYGSLNESDVIVYLKNTEGNYQINNILIDSKNKPIGGIIDYNNELISYYSIDYSLFENNTMVEDWKESQNKKLIDNQDVDLDVVEIDLSGYYILVEMFDENNDVYYSNIMQIK